MLLSLSKHLTDTLTQRREGAAIQTTAHARHLLVTRQDRQQEHDVAQFLSGHVCFLHVIDREATSFPSDRETVVCAVLADNTRPLAQRVRVSDRLPVVANSERVVDELARVKRFLRFAAARKELTERESGLEADHAARIHVFQLSVRAAIFQWGRVGELGGEAVPRTV